MLDHTGFVVKDLKAARRFYDAIAAALDLQIKEIGPDAFLLAKSAEQPIPYLWIGTPIPSYWAEGSRPGLNQMHIAFRAVDPAMVRAFHRAAMGGGGKDHGPPGPRKTEPSYYGAFVLDPDGNNIEACCRGAVAEAG